MYDFNEGVTLCAALLMFFSFLVSLYLVMKRVSSGKKMGVVASCFTALSAIGIIISTASYAFSAQDDVLSLAHGGFTMVAVFLILAFVLLFLTQFKRHDDQIRRAWIRCQELERKGYQPVVVESLVGMDVVTDCPPEARKRMRWLNYSGAARGFETVSRSEYERAKRERAQLSVSESAQWGSR